MIKINLKKRRDLLTAAGDRTSGGSVTAALIGRLNLEQAKELPIKKLAVPLLIGFMASFALDDFMAGQLEGVDKDIAKVKDQTEKLQKKITGFKTYDELKKTLDADELLIKTKLDTIHTLIANRSAPPQILQSISTSIPKESWLTELKVKDFEIALKGEAFGFGEISEFMRKLTNDPTMAKVELKSSQQILSPEFGEIASFELNLKRK